MNQKIVVIDQKMSQEVIDKQITPLIEEGYTIDLVVPQALAKNTVSETFGPVTFILNKPEEKE